MPPPGFQSELSARGTDTSENRASLEVELASSPGVGGLYLRGAARSARLAVANRAPSIATAIRAPFGGAGSRAAQPGAAALASVDLLVRGLRADAERLTAYQHLLGESASDALPAGFVHVLAFPLAAALMVRADFPLPLVGMVHLTNVIEQRRPLTLADALDVRAYARGLRPHRSGAQVELVTEVRTGPGELAWRGVSTYLARGASLAADVAAPDPADETGSFGGANPAGRPASADRPARPSARTFSPPDPTGQWRLAADVGRRYAAVSGDRNPIHLSTLTARALGFPRAIAHGMYTAARALAAVGAARTDSFTWTVEFAAPVLLPATVAVRVARNDDAPGVGYAAWNPRTGALHLAGEVTPG